MTEENYVAGDGAVAEEKTLDVQGPIEAKYFTRGEVGELFG